MSLLGKVSILFSWLFWGAVLRSAVWPKSLLRGLIQFSVLIIGLGVFAPTASRQWFAAVVGRPVDGRVSGRYDDQKRRNIEVQFDYAGAHKRADLLASQGAFEKFRENMSIRLRYVPLLKWVAIEGDAPFNFSFDALLRSLVIFGLVVFVFELVWTKR